MKRLFFLIVLIVELSNVYARFLGDNADSLAQATKWYGVIKAVGPYTGTSFQSATFYLQGDTVINDTTYKAFYRNDIYCAGLRQTADGQQVFIRPTEELMQDPYWEPGEHLLYNFDVEVGDTVFAFDGSYAGIDDMGEDLSIQYRWVVQDVQTIDRRKHVVVVGGQQHSHEVEWIEGIGTRFVLFENVYDDALWRTCSSYTLCAVDSQGNTLYSFDTDDIGVRNNCPELEIIPNEGIELVTADPQSATKLLRDGQILILRGDETYTIIGQKLQ
ncbi:MAG: hypothetical protein IKD12_03070 [Paludibacteraceae bacterium]|nr:hypothetical protein [Paludibacteraceae bacterium]